MTNAPHKPSGMEMMVMNLLRAMGFDPVAIREQVEGSAAEFMGAITRLNTALETTNERLARIETNQSRIMEAMGLKEMNGHGGGLLLTHEQETKQ